MKAREPQSIRAAVAAARPRIKARPMSLSNSLFRPRRGQSVRSREGGGDLALKGSWTWSRLQKRS